MKYTDSEGFATLQELHGGNHECELCLTPHWTHSDPPTQEVCPQGSCLTLNHNFSLFNDNLIIYLFLFSYFHLTKTTNYLYCNFYWYKQLCAQCFVAAFYSFFGKRAYWATRLWYGRRDFLFTQIQYFMWMCIISLNKPFNQIEALCRMSISKQWL